MSSAPDYLFIAGASRSGTTLLMNLLDAHRELLIFPMEQKVFKQYFTRPSATREAYFLDRFITERSEGQQTVLANRVLHQEYRDRMKDEFGIDFDLDVDSDRFLQRYREVLSTSEVALADILTALTEALVAANPYAASIYPHTRYVVYKDPFTTEFFARDAAEELPTSKFLHIIRDPYARYCSTKKRQLREGRLIKRRTMRRINFRDFATGFAEQIIASLQTGLENQRVLGETRYMIMRFEDLVENPGSTMERITDWLGIQFEEAMLQPSKLGSPIESGSSFSPTGKIDSRTADRGQQYFMKMTSPSERDVYNRCLAGSAYEKYYTLVSPAGGRQSISTWLKPYRHERVRDYVWRIVTGQGLQRRSDGIDSNALTQRLPQLYTSGRLG